MDKLFFPKPTYTTRDKAIAPGDPIFRCPNNFVDIPHIMWEIRLRHKVNREGQRKNVIIGMDASPFPLCIKVITYTFTHVPCGCQLYSESEDDILEHEELCKGACNDSDVDQSISNNDVVEFMRERGREWARTFPFIILKSGDFHLQLNAGQYILRKWQILYSNILKVSFIYILFI